MCPESRCGAVGNVLRDWRVVGAGCGGRVWGPYDDILPATRRVEDA